MNIEAYRSAASEPQCERSSARSILVHLTPLRRVLPSEATLSHPHETDSCATYVMNVSGLDSKRTDEIAIVLSDAILAQLRQ